MQDTHDEMAAPSFAEALATWAKIGVLSFGGPAGQIALMHRVVVDEKQWLDEPRFLSALNFCMLLPGPEAMQLQTYLGWRLHGVAGGLAAGLLFVLPGAVVVLALTAIYAAFGNVATIAAAFVGIKAAVLAIVVEALAKVARRALKADSDWWIAGAAFAAIFAFAVPFPVIVVAAAMIGYYRARAGDRGVAAVRKVHARDQVAPLGTVVTIAIWLAVWVVPLAILAAVLGPEHVLTQIGWFFSKLAVVTFGGAYAVLAYMAQQAVTTHGWLQPGEMLDGLGLAETTPGPLILVTEFVGFLAAFRAGGWWLGLAGAVVTLWATFAPCFLWIFAGAPYVEWLNAQPRLKGALAGVTAAVVGVILNLAVWFAINTLFSSVGRIEAWPLSVVWPELASVDLAALALAVLAFVLMFLAHQGVITTLAIAGAAALVAHWAGVIG